MAHVIQLPRRQRAPNRHETNEDISAGNWPLVALETVKSAGPLYSAIRVAPLTPMNTPKALAWPSLLSNCSFSILDPKIKVLSADHRGSKFMTDETMRNLMYSHYEDWS